VDVRVPPWRKIGIANPGFFAVDDDHLAMIAKIELEWVPSPLGRPERTGFHACLAQFADDYFEGVSFLRHDPVLLSVKNTNLEAGPSISG
jgi:hypothetical protein